jgi:prephenate dehydrogenase
MNIGIVGLGLIGGSFAKAIKKYTDHRVLGSNRSSRTVAKAIESGAVDEVLSDSLIGQCQLIIVSLYPEASIQWVTSHRQFIAPGTVVMDACGIKRPICRALEPVAAEGNFTFVGGHPMAGRELSGFDAALADLFVVASLILTDPHPPEMLTALAAQLGFSMVKCTTPENHDRMIAFTSQLAHIVSGAYVKSPSALEHKGYSAGSFKDLTRVAYLNETMWTELFMDNRDNLSREIGNIICELQKYKDAMDREDSALLKDLLREGREMKEKSNENSAG